MCPSTMFSYYMYVKIFISDYDFISHLYPFQWETFIVIVLDTLLQG